MINKQSIDSTNKQIVNKIYAVDSGLLGNMVMCACCKSKCSDKSEKYAKELNILYKLIHSNSELLTSLKKLHESEKRKNESNN